jgi:hypothetical protein
MNIRTLVLDEQPFASKSFRKSILSSCPNTIPYVDTFSVAISPAAWTDMLKEAVRADVQVCGSRYSDESTVLTFELQTVQAHGSKPEYLFATSALCCMKVILTSVLG